MYYLWKLTISQGFSLTHSIFIYFPSSLFLYHFPTLYFMCLLSKSSATFSYWFSFSLLTPLLLSLLPFLFWIPHRYLPSFLLSSCPLLFSSLLSSILLSSSLLSSSYLFFSPLPSSPLFSSSTVFYSHANSSHPLSYSHTSLLWPYFSSLILLLYLPWVASGSRPKRS